MLTFVYWYCETHDSSFKVRASSLSEWNGMYVHPIPEGNPCCRDRWASDRFPCDLKYVGIRVFHRKRTVESTTGRFLFKNFYEHWYLNRCPILK